MEEENKNIAIKEEVKYEILEVYEGAKFKTLLSRTFLARKPYTPADPTIIKSFIPGTIRKIFVKEGQSIVKGEKLCGLEAMKMINEILSPIDGKVKTLHIKTGMNVANHQVLVELEKTGQKKKKKK